MASLALLPVHAATAAASARALYHAYIAIRNVRTYEAATKRAAAYTRLAADQLHSTRSTCAAGALAALYSLLASTYPLIATQPSGWQTAIHGAFRAAVLVAARRHVAAFWGAKAKVPGLPVYNEAIDAMNALSGALRWLIVGAGVEALLGVVRMVSFF